MRRFIRKWKRKTFREKVTCILMYLLCVFSCFTYLTGVLLNLGIIK